MSFGAFQSGYLIVPVSVAVLYLSFSAKNGHIRNGCFIMACGMLTSGNFVGSTVHYFSNCLSENLNFQTYKHNN